MEANLNKIINFKISNTLENLKKNNFNAVYVPSSKEALALLQTLLIPGESIAVGGSVTLVQTGALNLIRSGKYNFIDRYEKGIDSKELYERLRKGLLADTFICSSNAITENGCLYNVDGTSNRVAAITFGPKRVIIIAGYNKIVPTLSDAVEHCKNISAPCNSVRLDKDTFCSKNGHCIKNYCDSRDLMMLPAGVCSNTICCNYVVSGFQREKGRITVIIIGENLGY